MNILESIRKMYSSFSKSNKSIADFILEEKGKIISMSAKEIGDSSGTSSATVVRFAKTLGFDGLEEMKYAMASIKEEKINRINPIISANDSSKVMIQKMSSLLITTIEDLNYTLDGDSLQQAIDLVKNAQNIYCLGIGASSLSAYNLYHKLNRSGKKSFFNFDAQMSIEFMHFSTSKDAVIAFSYSGLSREVILACQIAQKNKVPIIVITQNAESELAALASELLLVPDNEYYLRVGAISSLNSSMAVSDLLYLGSIQHLLGKEFEESIIEMTSSVNQLRKE